MLYFNRSQSLIKLSLESYLEKMSLKLSLFFLNSSWNPPFLLSSWKPVLNELVLRKLRISISARLCRLFLVFWAFVLRVLSIWSQWSLRVLSKSSLRVSSLWSIMASHMVLTYSIMTTSRPLDFSSYVSREQIYSIGYWLRVWLTCSMTKKMMSEMELTLCCERSC